jgi:hypothetical protein
MNDTKAPPGIVLTIESVPGGRIHSEDVFLRSRKNDFFLRGPRIDGEHSLPRSTRHPRAKPDVIARCWNQNFSPEGPAVWVRMRLIGNRPLSGKVVLISWQRATEHPG